MASLKELRRLRDEERTLVNIASKISDQLNRLKVEELALMSAMQMKTENKGDEPSIQTENNVNNNNPEQQDDEEMITEHNEQELPSLDLTVTEINTQGSDYEEEEEEEEDEDDDDLTKMMSSLHE